MQNAPPQWRGRTILQLSDLHLGTCVPDQLLLQAFEAGRRLCPDVVVMTGDFVTRAPVFPDDQFRKVYAAAPRGRIATLGVLGNHDYGIHSRDAEFAERICGALADCGVDVLRNSAVETDGLAFVGVDDYWGTNFSPMMALGGLRPDKPAVVLCHNPDVADMTVWGEYRGWILAGHTHGGQCRIPGLPPPFLPVFNRRYVAGEYSLAGGRRMYINRGVGHLLPFRFNVRPEITLFTVDHAGPGWRAV
jgi:uncharacterized protein